MMPKTNAIGKRMYNRQRVMSTQKLPTVADVRREKPRTRTMATAMPTAGETNCWTVSAPSARSTTSSTRRRSSASWCW